MELGTFILNQWDIIAANLSTFIVFGLICIASTFGVTRILFGAVADAARERLALATEKIAELKGERDTLSTQVATQALDIAELRVAVAGLPQAITDGLPRMHIAGRAPTPHDVGRIGDTWFQTGSTTDDVTTVTAGHTVKLIPPTK